MLFCQETDSVSGAGGPDGALVGDYIFSEIFLILSCALF